MLLLGSVGLPHLPRTYVEAGLRARKACRGTACQLQHLQPNHTHKSRQNLTVNVDIVYILYINIKIYKYKYVFIYCIIYVKKNLAGKSKYWRKGGGEL